MEKNNMIFVRTIKFALPAAFLLFLAAIAAGYYLQGAGVIFGTAVSLLNFMILEKIVRSLREGKSPAIKIMAKTLAAVGVLFAGIIYLGAPGVFAGVFVVTVSVFAAGLKVKQWQ